MRGRSWLGVLVLVLCTGCDSLVLDSDGVEVRVRNFSTIDFDSVTVRFPQETHRYGRVEAGRASAYRPVREAYRYDYVEAWIGTEKYVLQPFDFVGESLLRAGRYTYGLDFGGSPPRLEFIMADDPRVR